MTEIPERTWTAARFLRAGHHDATTSISEVRDWLRSTSARQHLEVERVPFSAMESWAFRDPDGRLAHVSGRFFSVEGLHVRTDSASYPEWTQPIIVQPEIGFLGLVAKEFDGVLHLLVQAKVEPGNLNSVQISPTVQATRSNYTGVHRGSRVRFIEHFDGTRPSQTLVDVLQSEQGAWFLHKRNRNVIVEVFEDIPEHENFRWLTVRQLRTLLREDNVVNMDLRTVLSCVPTVLAEDDPSALSGTDGSLTSRLLRSHAGIGEPRFTLNSTLSWITDVRTHRECVQRTVPLSRIDGSGWLRTDEGIQHRDKRYFEVFGARISTSDREVRSWTQPLFSPANPGLLALVVKDIGGTLHALVQMRVEAGGLNVAELAPTVHCQPENYVDAPHGYQPPYLDYVRAVPRSRIVHDTLQSEEGGRFYRAENRYMLIDAPDDFADAPVPGYRWMTFGQITTLLGHSHYVNVQLRSIVACAAAVFTPEAD